MDPIETLFKLFNPNNYELCAKNIDWKIEGVEYNRKSYIIIVLLQPEIPIYIIRLIIGRTSEK